MLALDREFRSGTAALVPGLPPPYPRDLERRAGSWIGRDVLAALRRGIKQKDDAKAAKAAGDYVALVYGRQLQHKEDEQPSHDPLDVSAMSNEEMDALKRRLVAEHPDAARALGMAS